MGNPDYKTGQRIRQERTWQESKEPITFMDEDPLALLAERNRLRAENDQLRAAAHRVMRAYAGNDWAEQTTALGALSDALCW